MKKPQVRLNLSSESQFKEDPKLFFPSLKDESNRYSDIESVSKKYVERHTSIKEAKEFWTKLQQSTEIIIIDDYAHEIPHDYIKKYLNKNATLKIFAGRKLKKLRKILEISDYNNIFLYKIAKTMQIHDRYATLDKELFHFGSTVGGCKEHFCTYSRGWRKDRINELICYLENEAEEIINKA